MKLFSKFLKVILVTAVGAILIWGGAYLISPTVKNWTNEHIFQIEQTVEDETPKDDESIEDETPEYDENGNRIPGWTGLPNPDDEPIDVPGGPENSSTTEE